jgi:hypothetical protein
LRRKAAFVSRYFLRAPFSRFKRESWKGL